MSGDSHHRPSVLLLDQGDGECSACTCVSAVVPRPMQAQPETLLQNKCTSAQRGSAYLPAPLHHFHLAATLPTT